MTTPHLHLPNCWTDHDLPDVTEPSRMIPRYTTPEYPLDTPTGWLYIDLHCPQHGWRHSRPYHPTITTTRRLQCYYPRAFDDHCSCRHDFGCTYPTALDDHCSCRHNLTCRTLQALAGHLDSDPVRRISDNCHHPDHPSDIPHQVHYHPCIAPYDRARLVEYPSYPTGNPTVLCEAPIGHDCEFIFTPDTIAYQPDGSIALNLGCHTCDNQIEIRGIICDTCGTIQDTHYYIQDAAYYDPTDCNYHIDVLECYPVIDY